MSVGFGPADEALGGRDPQPDRHRDGLLIGQQQGRHRAAGLEPVAAGDTGGRLDAVAQLAQPFHVAPHRALGDAEPLGQLGARPVPVRLQQVQEREGAGGRVGHDSRLP